MTFSIVARCPRTGALGVATSSKALSAGGVVPHCRAGTGAIASQAQANPYLGIDGLAMLEQGLPAERAIERAIESDAGRDLRQLAIVDKEGRVAAYTGERCIDWAGHLLGGGYVCLGNILTSEDVVKEMATTFERSIEENLPERLIRTLEAGQDAGGDRRGRQSAGIHVVQTEEYPYCDLRVDDHAEPVAELRRVLTIWQHDEPLLQLSPKRDDFTPLWEAVLRGEEILEESLQEDAAAR
jgi:uncharacterized Ntn-hydrolase superfamily protein